MFQFDLTGRLSGFLTVIHKDDMTHFLKYYNLFFKKVLLCPFHKPQLTRSDCGSQIIFAFKDSQISYVYNLPINERPHDFDFPRFCFVDYHF